MDVLKRRSSFRLFLAAAAALLCLQLAVSAQVAQPTPTSTANTADPRIASLLDTLDRVRTPTSAAISPDGSTVAWTFNGEHGSELHLTRIAPTGSAQNSAQDRVLSPDTIGDATRGKPGACTASHPAWSSDGSQLAFLSDCSDRGVNASGQNASSGKLHPTAQDNIFVWTLATNAMKQASHLHGEVSSLQWSPDGQSIAFLYVENASREAGALAAMKPWSGVIGEDNVEVQRVGVADADRGNLSIVTPQTLHVYEFFWRQDSKELAFIAATPPGENNWWIAKLYTEEIIEALFTEGWMGSASRNVLGTEPKLVLDPQTVSGPLHGLQIAVPRFSPDGKQIAFIGGLMSDQGSTGGDIWVVDTNGEHVHDVTPNIDGTPTWLNWQSDHTISFVEDRSGHTLLNAVNINDLKIIPGAPVDLGEVSIGGGPIKDAIGVAIPPTNHKNPTLAFVKSSYGVAPEVFAGPAEHLKQITHLNDAVKPAWGKSESIDYTNDGFHIQGWLLYPADYDPAKKYPLIVSVHGGPSSAVSPRWPGVNYGPVPFSALGYFVFMPNPRGSFGQGEKFTQANVKDFGYGDLRDILAGMDVLEKRFPIDKDREGITGWSYGGFMTMFAVTQTTRFRAAVAGAGLANWQSYYGENSIDQWMLPFFGASVYDDPAVYARSSPINFIKNVKTPTLMVVGDRDGECPAPQSFEFWHALRAEGVPAQLVVYPGEGHHFVSPQHQRDLLRRTIGWFQAEMPPR